MKQRKQITITIDTSNAAFDECDKCEVSRILRSLCREFSNGIYAPGELVLREINGNTVGRVTIEAKDNE